MNEVWLAVTLIGTLVFGLVVGSLITFAAVRQMYKLPLFTIHIFVDRTDRKLAEAERESLYGD